MIKNNIAVKFLNLLKSNNNKIIIGEKINNKWNTLNRKQLSIMVNNCINTLNINNINNGDRIAYIGNNSSNWLAWNLANYSVGGSWVPMFANQNDNYIKHIINDCKPKIFINDNQDPNKNYDIFNNQYTKTINNQIFNNDNNDFSIKETNSLATLIYTSGTTGPPKGVKLSHNNIISNIDAIHKRFYDLNNYKTLNILPWAHIYGLTCELYYNLLNNNTTYICNNKTEFINDCKIIKPNVIFVVPRILELVKKKIDFLDKPLIKCILPYLLNYLFGNNIDIIFIGGAKLDNNVKKFYENNNIIICEGYGCTETSPLVSVNHTSNPRNTDSIGAILDNVDIQIVNGEICISGPNVMEGYWDDNNKTNEKIFTYNSKKYYKSGDSGYIKDGFLFYNGRKSDNYKLTNGKFVNVNEIENIIKKYVHSNFIIFGENNSYNSIICDKSIDNNIINTINNNLDSFLKIKNVIIISEEEMNKFLTPKMSIKRNQLISYINNDYKKNIK